MTKRLLALAAAMSLAGCSLSKQTAPALAGPSGFGLSLAVTATPDIIAQDGRSQSTIAIVARDANSQPVKGLGLRVETAVNGTLVDFGTLSTKNTSTNDSGQASVTYSAPAAPAPTAPDDTTVVVFVTPVGSDYANANAQSVQLRLTRPGVILPPNGTPVPNFIFSPTQPKQDDNVLFDASASTDDGHIVTYAWNFGDGPVEIDTTPQTTHRYSAPGTYNVVLTVTDDGGLSASTAPQQVQVGAAATSTASFTFSPTTPIVNQSVNFNGSASAASGGHHIVSYDWDFGDGSPHGSGITTAHTYALPGNYTVVLDATDDSNHVGVASNTVAVTTAVPKAVIVVSPPSPPVSTVVQFSGAQSSAQGGNTLVLFQWDFGDGGHASGTNTTHTYTVAGTYIVQLVVTDNTGQTGATSQSVTVTP